MTDEDRSSRSDSSSNGSGRAVSKKKRSVSFSPMTDVREYTRQYNGSGGVPYRGGYPLGLGASYVEKKEPLVSAKMKMAQIRSGHMFMPLTEKERKKVLRQSDPSCPKNDSTNRMELDKLRLSRMRNAGCSCTFGRCNSETCDCYAIGLPCVEGNCSCTRCMNPYERPSYDDDDDDDDDDEEYADDEEDEDEDGETNFYMEEEEEGEGGDNNGDEVCGKRGRDDDVNMFDANDDYDNELMFNKDGGDDDNDEKDSVSQSLQQPQKKKMKKDETETVKKQKEEEKKKQMGKKDDKKTNRSKKRKLVWVTHNE